MTQERVVAIAHSMGNAFGPCPPVPGVSGCTGLCLQAQGAISRAIADAIRECAAKAEDLRNQAAVEVEKARAARNDGDFVRHLGAASMAEMIRRLILLPEGGCRLCLNSTQVASTIVAGAVTRCPACAGQEGTVAQ